MFALRLQVQFLAFIIWGIQFQLFGSKNRRKWVATVGGQLKLMNK